MTDIIIIIIVLLVISVIGSVIFTKKEQAAAQRRQQVASYRYKADEAQDLYDGLQNAGLEKKAYAFLLDRIIVNLEAAYKIDPKAPGIKVRLNSAKSTLQSIDTISFYIQMPSAMSELHGLVGRLNKLVKYLILLFQKRLIAEHQYQEMMPAVQRTLLKFDAEGHIKMGHQAANDGQPGTAKQCYMHAKEKLLGFDQEDSYVMEQLGKVDELLATLDKESVIPGGVPMEQLNEEQQNQAAIAETDDRTKEELAAAAAQEELNRQAESDGSFTPKKKW